MRLRAGEVAADVEFVVLASVMGSVLARDMIKGKNC